MTFLIAAAGTGGHVFPGLAVGEALAERGVAKEEVLFIGGERLEATVYPEAGFPFLAVELRGFQRSMTTRNLSLPRLVWRARARIGAAIGERGVRVALGMGGYVTVPTALAARRERIPLLIAEQNAGAGLANRIASRWAARKFTSFPETSGLEDGEWVGNPVRRSLAEFDRDRLRPQAMSRYELDPELPVLGVFGGSLGAGSINAAVAGLVKTWSGAPIQVVHLTGEDGAGSEIGRGDMAIWKRRGFEDRMELFYAAADLVVARAGGGVAELTVTGTPSVLVPGEFGSTGHQAKNAAFLEEAGAAVVLPQSRIAELPDLVGTLLFSPERLQSMRSAAGEIAKPGAAMTIADAMLEQTR
ncbi:MAG TPA: UDP-N-acetylglucosamine--N-acetylmuramyl-(pentapeptide) pyrophosphoryl-undecaprenol N-acetylglucosamine transferase [Acidimicrobiia bacterium]